MLKDLLHEFYFQLVTLQDLIFLHPKMLDIVLWSAHTDCLINC